MENMEFGVRVDCTDSRVFTGTVIMLWYWMDVITIYLFEDNNTLETGVIH